MARIKHPNPPSKGTFIDRLGGLKFYDGYAYVDLADKPNLHAALIQHKYDIEYDVDDLFTDQPEEITATMLEDLTIAELRDIANVEGIDIPKQARKKAEIISAIEACQTIRILEDGQAPAEPLNADSTVSGETVTLPSDSFGLLPPAPAGATANAVADPADGTNHRTEE
ncbi:hypothetical protein B7R22_17180 [Subtercola boreus]|uniref:Uncharacterized protein n=1 Tax=Subtercola boreus TaxID=120213 RepID=A0A3E0VR32_9MICO|nr:hypothetical protein [Subtercola boreus]RFA12161.1 hypothetical protein B7R22_17180 [Subtercola boreus]